MASFVIESLVSGNPSNLFGPVVNDGFNPLKSFPSMVLAWEIGSLVGKVAKLDIKINSGVRGQFAMIVVFVDLKKPLTSQVLINKRVGATMMVKELLRTRWSSK
ncbi:hypothetical protein GOBAR_AA32349 [Gossypium barbadense]|uniref:Uncharacterized protein n=1 Tax=Gossypium barbadense TaxID=3634 RepID=A0A2P5WB75_GOSBA|nr:hypothetical protein GOBAR_AA32349 [Gossypium barbadense]